MLGKQITARQLTELETHHDANYANRECKVQLYGHYTKTMKNNINSCMLHDNVSRNGYGNVIIGRYGGRFEEHIMRLMYEKTYHPKDLDASAKFAPTLNMRKCNARYRRG